MKKKLLILGSLGLTMCLNAQVTTFVGTNALVTVKDGALVYSGGGWQNATAGNVTNEGDIMVVGTIADNDVFNIAADAEFSLKFISQSAYGQLYINGIPQSKITGEVRKEFLTEYNTGETGWQQQALPFSKYSVEKLQEQLGYILQISSTALTTAGRFNAGSVFRWNNVGARFDQVLTGYATVGKATDYYIIPKKAKDGAAGWNVTEQKVFRGIPVSDVVGADNQNVTNALPLAVTNVKNFGSGGTGINAYREIYNTYLDDPFVSKTVASNWTASGNYGKDLSQFANPFLTNLDLSSITSTDNVSGDNDGVALSNVLGIAYYTSDALSWTPTAGTTYDSAKKVIALTSGGKFTSGDVNKAMLKPMQEAMIKFSVPQTSVQNLNLNNTRRFSQTPRTASNYSVAGRSAYRNTADVVKQVAVVLYNIAGNEITRTYYAVSPNSITGYTSDLHMQAYTNNYPIYTKEEKVDGGEDLNQSYQLYINEANENDFKGKKLPLYVAYTEPATIKFELYNDGVRVADGESLPNGKSFYIENNGTITSIKDGSSMPLSGSSYGLYYDSPEATLGTGVANKNQTLIAKKDNEWVVRFATGWKKAKVEVYSAAGQLIHNADNVSTSSDYVLPLNSNVAGLYLIRTTSDSGEVVTKKIVK